MKERTIAPGAAIGVLGGGQLARMFAFAARGMGYRVHVLTPEADSPAGRVADLHRVAAYEDADAVRGFARGVDVVTLEFENVPVAAAEACASLVPMRPGGHVLRTTQHRLREKQFLADRGFPVVPFAPATCADEVAAAVSRLGGPCVAKTATSGYDGSGQCAIDAAADAASAFEALGGRELVVEARLRLATELSVVVARSASGAVAVHPVFENRHDRHVLDTTICPAGVPAATARDAVEIACSLAALLEAVGVLCVEFFVAEDGRLLVNEIAPRPHNSGHLSIDACATSQFEQQARAVCGLPLGDTDLLRPAAMANLLGELWAGRTPCWAAALAVPGVRLHLYGKSPRPRRKMGHLTALGACTEEARARVLAARGALSAGGPA